MSQLVSELKKCESFKGSVSIVTLTSRKGLCVHEKVKKVESVTLQNEKCEELTEKGNCPYNDQGLTDILTDNVLQSPIDIEELGNLANRMQICGYFAARKAAAEADIIVAPYQTILSEATRSSVGISLFNKVLVFDEAHNIMETVSSLNTVRMSYSNFYLAYTQVKQYLNKYEGRLAAKNAKFLRDIAGLCADFIKYIKE